MAAVLSRRRPGPTIGPSDGVPPIRRAAGAAECGILRHRQIGDAPGAMVLRPPTSSPAPRLEQSRGRPRAAGRGPRAETGPKSPSLLARRRNRTRFPKGDKHLRRVAGPNTTDGRRHTLVGDRQAERRHEVLRCPAAPLGGRAHLLLVRPKPASLAKDFENLAETLATFVTLASIQLVLRRLARA
jgi:hypothetical protein